MKTLLYFEEYESKLSHSLFKRNDINLVIIRTTKNMKFFSNEYVNKTNKYNCYVIDFDNDINIEVEKFKNWLEEKKLYIDCFLNDSEYYLEFSNRFARMLELDVLSEEQVKKVRDKVSMKKAFVKAGIKTTDFCPINNKTDLIEFWVQRDCCPIIVKPRNEMNSKGVYKIENFSDIESLPYDIVPNKYMVEVFCYGHEWSIESLVQDGIVLDSYLSYLPNATIWASIENKLHAHMTCINQPDFFEMPPKDYIQRIVDAFELKNGTMTIEIFVMPNGNMIASELGWRLPGGMACENHSLSYGFDIWNSLIDIAIGKKVTLKYADVKKCVGVLKLPNLEGTIKYVTPLKKLLNYNGVIDGEVFAKIGEFQKKRRVGSDCSGWIQVSGIDTFDVLKKMQTIYDNFKIEVAENKTIVRRLRNEKK